MEILSEDTNEEPVYSEFIKGHFMGPCPGMANLNYDPFPEAGTEDVVRKEIVGRKLVWTATIKGSDFDFRPGVVVERNGHRFAVVSSKFSFGTGICEVTGDELQGECEPVKTLARLRTMYAAGNPK